MRVFYDSLNSLRKPARHVSPLSQTEGVSLV